MQPGNYKPLSQCSRKGGLFGSQHALPEDEEQITRQIAGAVSPHASLSKIITLVTHQTGGSWMRMGLLADQLWSDRPAKGQDFLNKH